LRWENEYANIISLVLWNNIINLIKLFGFKEDSLIINSSTLKASILINSWYLLNLILHF